MSDTLRILMTFEDPDLQWVIQGIDGYRLEVAPDHASALAAISEADVACVAGFDRELLDRAKKLRWIQAFLGGVERVLFPELIESSIPLTCVKECFGAPGADHAMAVLLAVSYRVDYYLRAQVRRNFSWSRPLGLEGMTLGIIGFGNIGQALATRARVFGLRTLAVARRPRTDPVPADEVLTLEQLPRLLSESDFVVVAVPSTHETKGLIGAAQLAQMRSTAWLIDISGREAIVSQSDVIDALNQGRIAGADLQFKAPPPVDSPLWNMNNLIMSQYSANSERETTEGIALVVDNMRRFRDGLPLRGLVDKVAGY